MARYYYHDKRRIWVIITSNLMGAGHRIYLHFLWGAYRFCDGTGSDQHLLNEQK